MLPITSLYGILHVARCLTFVHELYWRRIYNGTEIPFKPPLRSQHSIYMNTGCALTRSQRYTQSAETDEAPAFPFSTWLPLDIWPTHFYDGQTKCSKDSKC